MSYLVLDKYREFLFTRNGVLSLGGIILFTAYLFFPRAVTMSVFFAAFLLLNFFLSFFLRPLKRFHIGIEIIMLSTVLTGYIFGAFPGALMGALSIITYYIAQRTISIFSILTIPLYTLIGALAATLSGFSILSVGITLTIMYNLINSLVIFFFYGGSPLKCGIFNVTNLICNWYLFSTVAPFLLVILS